MTYAKICGITNTEDALASVEAGADLLGFVFYQPSPRFVQPERAREIVRVARALAPGLRFVGVFVDEPVERMRAVMQLCNLDLVQLHGAEPPHMVEELSPGCYKSLRPLDSHDATALLGRYRGIAHRNVPAFIVDAFNPTLFGGTGKRADWTIAHTIAREFPVLLAGGLTPENVGMAIASVRPWGVDVSSGVERVPGLKDHGKIRRFLEMAKNEIGVAA
jgi:phosphoribosylanthranilate isomerase